MNKNSYLLMLVFQNGFSEQGMARKKNFLALSFAQHSLPQSIPNVLWECDG